MTENDIFREFECGLFIADTAELCFKSVRTIKEWDKGKEIPKECRRLMRKQSRLELSCYEEWQGFRMTNRKLELPTGQKVTPQEILSGIGLLQINSELELKTKFKVLKLARKIARLLTTQ